MTVARHRRQPRRYTEPKNVTALQLSDPWAADEDNHDKHIRLVFADRKSGFPDLIEYVQERDARLARKARAA